MPQQLRYVAQQAMDNFYQQYKGEDDWYDLDDFILNCGNTIAAIYLSYYQQNYAMNRQDRNGEGISFDAGWLLEQEAEVTKEGKVLFANLSNSVMTFPYDNNATGIQNVFITDPFSYDELERTTLSAIWQLQYTPKVNRIFFFSDVAATGCESISRLGFVNKGNCNIKKIRVLYVPVMNDGYSNVADGVISDAVIKTVLAMKQMASGVVVDETENQNSNKVLQTELDKKTLIN